MKYREQSPTALHTQQALQILGFELSRHGADGVFGAESWHALEDFARANGLSLGDNDELDEGIEAESVAATARGEADAEVRRAQSFADNFDTQHTRNLLLLTDHNSSHRKGIRDWSEIDSIVLHQTGYIFPNRNAWKTLRAHIGVPRTDEAWYGVHDLREMLWHSQGTSRRSVGIEIEGNCYGLEGDKSTWWRPPSSVQGEKRGPHTVTEQQIANARDAVRLIVATALECGGKIRNIFAHRQSSKNRIADPGETIWREVGLWAQQELGLNDGGVGCKFGSGYLLPDDWTLEERGVSYR